MTLTIWTSEVAPVCGSVPGTVGTLEAVGKPMDEWMNEWMQEDKEAKSTVGMSDHACAVESLCWPEWLDEAKEAESTSWKRDCACAVERLCSPAHVYCWRLLDCLEKTLNQNQCQKTCLSTGAVQERTGLWEVPRERRMGGGGDPPGQGLVGGGETSSAPISEK